MGSRTPILAVLVLAAFLGSGSVVGQSLSLERDTGGLVDWKLFQRGPDGYAPVPIAFSYASPEGARLEVRLRDAGDEALPDLDFSDLSWDLPASPEPSPETVSVLVPQGGNYDLEVRLVRPGDGTVLAADAVHEIAVGDVFLAGGQSNMTGNSSILEPSEPPSPDVHLFGNDYVWKLATEPMDSAVGQVDAVSADPSARHSLMLRFAKRIASEAGVPIAIVPGSSNGSSVFNWQRPADPTDRSSLYGSSVHRILAQGYDHPIRGMIWYQGESDVGNTVELYRSALQQMVDDLRYDLTAPELYFASMQLATSEIHELGAWLDLQQAQRLQADDDPRSVLAPALDLPRVDEVHLTLDGYKAAGDRLARAVLGTAYDLPQLRPAAVVCATLSPASLSEIVVGFDQEITGGDDPTLWRLVDTSGEVEIEGAVRESPSIRLLLGRSLEGLAHLSYGYSTAPDAAWVEAAGGGGAAIAFEDLPLSNACGAATAWRKLRAFRTLERRSSRWE